MEIDENLINQLVDPGPVIMPQNLEPLEDDVYVDSEEIDYRSINVKITSHAPIVILFGHEYCGKTLALFRMTRYLEKMGYLVTPDITFRDDTIYHRMCTGYKHMVHRDYCPGGNDMSSFMLVRVLDPTGRIVLQILDAGGHYFYGNNGYKEFPLFIEQIIHSPYNRLIWLYFVELGWKDHSERIKYVEQLRDIHMRTHQVGRRDNEIFLFCKADKNFHLYNKKGYPDITAFHSQTMNEYPGIFDGYVRKGLAGFLFGKYNYKSIAFSAGSTARTDPRLIWQESDSWYCEQLWKAIKSCM